MPPTITTSRLAFVAALVGVGLVVWVVKPSAPTTPRSAFEAAVVDDASKNLSATASGSSKIPEAFRVLSEAGLSGDADALTRLFSPETSSSPVAAAFEAVLADPVEANVRAFFEASRSELSDRTSDTIRGGRPERPGSEESTRDLALRILIATEYARAAGKVDPSFADYAAWNASVLIRMSDVSDVRDAAYAMIEQRLLETQADEARWAAIPEEQVADDLTEDSKSRHWTWAMLHAAMDHAADQGRAGDVEAYARRYESIPQSGTEQERAQWRKYKRDRVAEAKQRLELALVRR
jgi:hypothetical protein